jgi:hypothetical protein
MEIRRVVEMKPSKPVTKAASYAHVECANAPDAFTTELGR